MNKIILRLLSVLGVGTATLCVTACYGPIPQNYDENKADEEYIDSLCEVISNDSNAEVFEDVNAIEADSPAE